MANGTLTYSSVERRGRRRHDECQPLLGAMSVTNNTGVSSRRRCAGLTFLELMVVMIVVAVLVAVAVSPPMRGMLARQHVEGMHAELLTDLRLARSEALQRSGSSTSVAVTFGANADVSCYTIHVVVPGVVCDCTRAPGDVCLPAAPGQELKSALYPRAAGYQRGRHPVRAARALSLTHPRVWRRPMGS